MDRAAVRLVVERDVPGYDGRTDRPACGSDSVDRLGELPTDLRLLGVAEVETVREADRLTADTRDISCRLEHGERATRERVETRDAALAVEREGEPAHRRSQPQHGRIEPRAADRSGPHELVVAPVDELATAECR